MSVQIQRLSRENSNFYSMMGPFFGSRKVAADVGIHIYDDSNKAWFAAISGGRLIGFASLRCSVISDCYVIPAFRFRGVFSSILSQILLAHDACLKANCTQASLGVFLAHGFVEKSRTKNFTRVEWKCQKED